MVNFCNDPISRISRRILREATFFVVKNNHIFRSLAFRDAQVRPGQVPPRFCPARAALQAPLPSLMTDFAMALGGRGGEGGDGAGARHRDGPRSSSTRGSARWGLPGQLTKLHARAWTRGSACGLAFLSRRAI